jgi:hypothetical protein
MRQLDAGVNPARPSGRGAAPNLEALPLGITRTNGAEAWRLASCSSPLIPVLHICCPFCQIPSSLPLARCRIGSIKRILCCSRGFFEWFRWSFCGFHGGIHVRVRVQDAGRFDAVELEGDAGRSLCYGCQQSRDASRSQRLPDGCPSVGHAEGGGQPCEVRHQSAGHSSRGRHSLRRWEEGKFS